MKIRPPWRCRWLGHTPLWISNAVICVRCGRMFTRDGAH